MASKCLSLKNETVIHLPPGRRKSLCTYAIPQSSHFVLFTNRCSLFVPTSTFEVSLVQKDWRHPVHGVVLGQFKGQPGEIIDFLDQSEFVLSFSGLSLRGRYREGHSPRGLERWNVIHHHHDQLLTRDQRGSNNRGWHRKGPVQHPSKQSGGPCTTGR